MDHTGCCVGAIPAVINWCFDCKVTVPTLLGGRYSQMFLVANGDIVKLNKVGLHSFPGGVGLVTWDILAAVKNECVLTAAK
jgi:hypothetical protein